MKLQEEVLQWLYERLYGGLLFASNSHSVIEVGGADLALCRDFGFEAAVSCKRRETTEICWTFVGGFRCWVSPPPSRSPAMMGATAVWPVLARCID